jgi:hypothetical protein
LRKKRKNSLPKTKADPDEAAASDEEEDEYYNDDDRNPNQVRSFY